MRLPPPIMASLDITYKCNLTCRMCNVWRISRKEKELPIEGWIDIIDQLVKVFSLKFFRLVGGEPLVSDIFREVVHHIKSIGCRLDLVTNGTLIDEGIAEFLVSEHVDRIRISINGLKETDEFYRGKGVFSRTMRGIQILTDRIETHAANAPIIAVQSFVSRVNYKEIRELLNLSRRLRVLFSYHYLAGDIKGEKRSKDPGFPGKPDEQTVMTFSEKRAFEKRLLHNLSFPERVVRMLMPAIHAIPVGRDCPRVSNHFLIDPWGYVFPCENLYEYGYGNCRTESVKEIWESPNRRILRQHVRKGDLQACHDCGRLVFWPPVDLSWVPIFKCEFMHIGL